MPIVIAPHENIRNAIHVEGANFFNILFDGTSASLTTSEPIVMWVGMQSNLRIDDEEHHERHDITLLAHIGLGKQIVLRVCVHGFGVAYIRSVDV